MNEPKEAIQLVKNLISAVVETVKQENFRKGGASARALRAERKAAKALLTALLAQPPTEKEIDKALEF